MVKLKILICDDETEILRYLQKLLEGKGYQVETFSSDGPRRVFFNPNGSGFTFGFRDWYEESAGTRRKVIECNYGYLKGNGAAIKRLVSA